MNSVLYNQQMMQQAQLARFQMHQMCTPFRASPAQAPAHAYNATAVQPLRSPAPVPECAVIMPIKEVHSKAEAKQKKAAKQKSKRDVSKTAKEAAAAAAARFAPSSATTPLTRQMGEDCVITPVGMHAEPQRRVRRTFSFRTDRTQESQQDAKSCSSSNSTAPLSPLEFCDDDDMPELLEEEGSFTIC
eukprot:Rhum_TRINITY_DN14186_c11_g1::Rhum_TRINITY_DN14186_c11_g1_i1::g.72974::m.72974